jgi:hypothetical protein
LNFFRLWASDGPVVPLGAVFLKFGSSIAC